MRVPGFLLYLSMRGSELGARDHSTFLRPSSRFKPAANLTLLNAALLPMKTVLLLVLLALSLTCSAHASGPITIDIATTDTGITYTLHDYNRRIEKNFQKPDEIEAWLRAQTKQVVGEFVLIYPDDRTSFKT